MADVNGTNGNNDIEIDNTNGPGSATVTVDGNPVTGVPPVDVVAAGDGDDTITVTNSTVEDTLDAGGGNDQVFITDSTLERQLLGGLGDDTISVSNSTTAAVRGDEGADVIDIDGNSDIRNVQGGDGVDRINITDSAVSRTVTGNDDNDSITLNNSLVGRDLAGGDGNDTIQTTATSVSQSVLGGAGDDRISLTTTDVTEDVSDTGGSNTFDIDQSTIGGSVIAGDLDDTIRVTDSDITGTIEGGGGRSTIDVSSGSQTGSILTGAGEDEIDIFDSTVNGIIETGAEEDDVFVNRSTVGSVDVGDGRDDLFLWNATVTGVVDAGGGQDRVYINNLDASGGVIDGGADNDLLQVPLGSVITDDTFGVINVTAVMVFPITGGTVLLPTGQTVSYQNFELVRGEIPCYVEGTRIRTTTGERPIEDLRAGDLLWVASGPPQPIRWVGAREIDGRSLAMDERRYPVRICAGALGPGRPARDLLVSRQHRILIRSKIAQRMFGTFDVLVAAARLIGLPGIFVDRSLPRVRYFHILLDDHAVLMADGALAESLLLGERARRFLSPAQIAEIDRAAPWMRVREAEGQTRQVIPLRKRQKKLIAGHVKNGRFLFDARLLCRKLHDPDFMPAAKLAVAV